MWEWVQNADRRRVEEWRASGDLPGHVFGIKHSMQVKWHTDEVIEGFPRWTEWHSAADLFDRDVVGLYARRRER